MQLGFILSNGVTDTLESSSILIYFETRKSIYTRQSGWMPYLIKQLIKKGDKKLWPSGYIFELNRKAANESLEGNCVCFALQNFNANAKNVILV
jgi:hypothetical protein